MAHYPFPIPSINVGVRQEVALASDMISCLLVELCPGSVEDSCTA